jgi:hypothetical protein
MNVDEAIKLLRAQGFTVVARKPTERPVQDYSCHLTQAEVGDVLSTLGSPYAKKFNYRRNTLNAAGEQMLLDMQQGLSAEQMPCAPGMLLSVALTKLCSTCNGTACSSCGKCGSLRNAKLLPPSDFDRKHRIVSFKTPDGYMSYQWKKGKQKRKVRCSRATSDCTVTRAKLHRLVTGTQFHASVKKRFLHNTSKANRATICDAVTQNLRALLGKAYAKAKLRVYAVFGAGVFGLTLGVENSRGVKYAIKIVQEADAAGFKREIKMHQKLARADLAPKPFQPIYTGVRVPKGQVFGYRMEQISSDLEPVFFAARSKDEVKQMIRELVGVVDRMDKANMVHGDMHWGNIAVQNQKVTLIDFGRTRQGRWPAIDMIQLFRVGAMVLAAQLENCAREETWACGHYKQAMNRLVYLFKTFVANGYRNRKGSWEAEASPDLEYLFTENVFDEVGDMLQDAVEALGSSMQLERTGKTRRRKKGKRMQKLTYKQHVQATERAAAVFNDLSDDIDELYGDMLNYYFEHYGEE